MILHLNVYGNGNETISHLFVECNLARDCWNYLNGPIILNNYSSFTDWVEINLRIFYKDQSCLFIVICWMIWLARNDVIWNSRFTTGRIIVEKDKHYLRNWKEIVENVDLNSRPGSNFVEKWVKPEAGWLKINTDAAVDRDNGRMGFGWVLPNENGSFKAAMSIPGRGVYEAEAIAIRDALSWMKEQRMDFCQIETDALQVVHALQTDDGDSYFSLVLLDIKDLLSSFSHVFISFAKCSANRTAHLLARESFSMSKRRVWFPHPLLSWLMLCIWI